MDLKTRPETSAEVLADPKVVLGKVVLPGSVLEGEPQISGLSPQLTYGPSWSLPASRAGAVRFLRIHGLIHCPFPVLCSLLAVASRASSWWHIAALSRDGQTTPPDANLLRAAHFFFLWIPDAGSLGMLGVPILDIWGSSSRRGKDAVGEAEGVWECGASLNEFFLATCVFWVM